MAEPDHVYLRPMPNFMSGDKPASYNFGLDPARPEVCRIVKRCVGTDARSLHSYSTAIPGIGGGHIVLS